MPDVRYGTAKTSNPYGPSSGVVGYTDKSGLASILYGLDNGNTVSNDDIATITAMASATTNGIEGMPYQFDSVVDRRPTTGANSGTELKIGRKYAEKIYSRMPLLFLTPCRPVFAGDFDKKTRTSIAGLTISTISGESIPYDDALINGVGRYYTVEFDYDSYWGYVNTMLRAVAIYLGIANVPAGPNNRTLGTASWQEESNASFGKFWRSFRGYDSIVYYLDGMESISRSFSNETGESSLASQINGYADTANEIRFLFGNSGGLVGALAEGASELTSSITDALSGAIGSLGGGIVGSLAGKGVNTILNGGKIVFPKIWTNSSADESYNLQVKLRSPDHDKLSIFLNILKPYCKLLALTMPHQYYDKNSGKGNPYGYISPFLCKAHCKGMFSIDYGIISSLNVNAGAQCQWSDDGLPTQVDIDIDIANLYNSLAISNVNEHGTAMTVHNTAYLDFLANLSGLNVNDMEIGRRIELYFYYIGGKIGSIPSNLYTKLDQGMSRIASSFYRKLT